MKNNSGMMVRASNLTNEYFFWLFKVSFKHLYTITHTFTHDETYAFTHDKTSIYNFCVLWIIEKSIQKTQKS